MMRFVLRVLTVLLIVAFAPSAWAQTVDEVIEKSLTAMGGRAALEKLKSRAMAGTITLGTPMGEIPGTIEMLIAAPNKTRTVVKADLTALGAGPLVIDTRFDGKTGVVLDSLQGDREMAGTQLASARNGAFPHPFLAYKTMGTAAKLVGKEKAGDRDAYIIQFEPKAGSPIRVAIDAETYLTISSTTKVDVPQLGQEVDQTSTFSDYREVDGVKVPFEIKASSPAQSYTIVVSKLQHNVPVDESLFSKPPAKQ